MDDDGLSTLSTLGGQLARSMISRLGEIEDMVVGFQEDGTPAVARFEGEKATDLAVEQAVQIVRERSGAQKVLTILSTGDTACLTIRNGLSMLAQVYSVIRDVAGRAVDIDLVSSSETVEGAQ